MNQEMQSEFEHLWTTDKGRYVLKAPNHGCRPEQMVILERETEMATIIEDGDAYKEVIERMRQAGVPVVYAMA